MNSTSHYHRIKPVIDNPTGIVMIDIPVEQCDSSFCQEALRSVKMSHAEAVRLIVRLYDQNRLIMGPSSTEDEREKVHTAMDKLRGE